MNNSNRLERIRGAKLLLADIDTELTRRQTPKTILEHMRKSALAGLRAELKELHEILSTAKHRLIIIGQVGVGKTTAICHLVGLTADREKRKTSKTGAEKAVLVTEDLLATGSGFTTLCEVVVTPGDKNKFTIEPHPVEEVKRMISDFCHSVWRKIHPIGPDDGQAGDQHSLPPELVRAVRNLTKLPDGAKREDDMALQLAREFPPLGFEHFVGRVLSHANITSRSQTEFACPADEPDARAWIKKTFDDLNLVRLDTVSIPRRITLQVDMSLVSPHMARVASVVDTKGVDAAQFNREDLDNYIRADRSAICILAEGFDTAPSNVAPFLQRHLTPEAPLLLSKFALLILPRGAEPEKAVGQLGPVGDRDLGISLRRGQVEATLAERGIIGLQTLFFDPLRHFESAGVDFKLRSDSDIKEVGADRDEAWAVILQAIDARQDKVWARVIQIGDSLKKIKDGKGLDPGEEELIHRTKGSIAEYRRINLPNADRFLEKYCGLWKGPGARHMSILRATNSRFGVYPFKNINVYYDAVPIAEQLIRNASARHKEAMLDIVRAARSSTAEDSDLRELFAILETRIDASFEDMVRQVGIAMQEYIRDAFAPPDHTSAFWARTQNRYGQGPGYRDDVLSMYAAEIPDNQEIFVTAAEDSWLKVSVNPVLEYLG